MEHDALAERREAAECPLRLTRQGLRERAHARASRLPQLGVEQLAGRPIDAHLGGDVRLAARERAISAVAGG